MDNLDRQRTSGLQESIRKIMASSSNRHPTEETLGYTSISAFHGTKLRLDDKDQLYLDYRGLMPWVDRVGDDILRRTDDHLMKEPLKMLKRKPGAFTRQVFTEPKRHRGTVAEILRNVQRLGLQDRYTPYPDAQNPIGIAIVDNFVKKGSTLRDMYRASSINAEQLKDVDRFETLTQAAQYLHTIHDNFGAVGEVNTDDFIFMNRDEGKLTNPVLNIPDIVYTDSKMNHLFEPLQIRKLSLQVQHENCILNSDESEAAKFLEEINKVDNEMTKLKNGIERERKAIDVLDFIFDAAEEEYSFNTPTDQVQRDVEIDPQRLRNMAKAVRTIIEGYGDKDILRVVKSFVARGRLTLAGDNNLTLNQDTLLSMLNEDTANTSDTPAIDTNHHVPNIPDSMFTKPSVRRKLALHNQVRLRTPENLAVVMKNLVYTACNNEINKKQEAEM